MTWVMGGEIRPAVHQAPDQAKKRLMFRPTGTGMEEGTDLHQRYRASGSCIGLMSNVDLL